MITWKPRNHLEAGALGRRVGEKESDLAPPFIVLLSPFPIKALVVRGTFMLTRGRGEPSRSLLSRPESWCQPPRLMPPTGSSLGGSMGGVVIMCEWSAWSRRGRGDGGRGWSGVGV